MGVELGEEVGYAIRFEDCTSKKTVVKYMTGKESSIFLQILFVISRNFYSYFFHFTSAWPYQQI